MRKILLLFVAALSITKVLAQPAGNQPWKTDIALGSFVLTTFLTEKKDGNTLLFSSPKNADKRVVGTFKSFAGRLFKKIPKKGRFLNIKTDQNGDSLTGMAAMPVLGKVTFKGTLSEVQNRLEGVFIKEGKTVGKVTGYRSDTSRLQYGHLYSKITDLAQAHLYSRAAFATPEWKDFTKTLKSLTANAHDDIELFLGFSIASQQLPFSHFNLVLQPESSAEEVPDTAGSTDVTFEEKGVGTAYVKIANFSSTQAQIAILMSGIIAKNYQNLILDLRNNGGGGLEAALELASYVLKDSVLIGYFPTNRFGAAERNVATLSQLPVTTVTTTEAFIEEMKTTAGKTLTAPKPTQSNVFGGKLYILTNNKTASTCEPIAYVFKNKLGATLVGQTTAGAMLSAAYFTIEGKYKLVLPIADFYAYDGKRLEGVGVVPNIALPAGEDALAKTLSIISEGN